MKVYLIGAGPGDPGLLTVRGREILERADVVVYDYLAGSSLLRLIRPDAERIYVGKTAGRHTLPQSEINQLIIRKAREGKTVARLKGGDPYIFGRGGEEAEELIAAGIPFEEIPGISSTIAGPAYAGIPLTHRDFTSSVTLITGHENPDKPGSSLNWSALASIGGTLVFVMGMKNLPDISAKLIAAGLDPNTPAALVHWGTTSRHRSLTGTVASLPSDAVKNGFSNPSVIVIGNVVRLHDMLNWFERKPLLGKTVIVTRSREQASALSRKLEENGAEIVEFPAIRMQPVEDFRAVDDAAAHLAEYDTVVFTSANGVRFFFLRLEDLGLDARIFANTAIAAIGTATAAALRTHGLKADFIPEKFVAEDVASGLIAQGVENRRILILRAREARDVLPEMLRQAGADVSVIPLYETVPDTGDAEAVLTRLKHGEIDCITFGSSSTVKNFFSAIPPDAVCGVATACIGPVTAKTLSQYGMKADITPDIYTIQALTDAVCAYFSSESEFSGAKA
ncbi:MAG: uroporphyrinogen-III C-methyltransferase [Desulfovibrionaceae bacterium]|nr:uroporphyrinogen-III C-methyltransferase [Desulfovibrionaceae bacterium]